MAVPQTTKNPFLVFDLCPSILFFFFLKFISCLWLHCSCLQTHQKRGIRSHYRWLWATMWLLGLELRTFGRAVSALNRWAISLACILKIKINFIFYVCVGLHVCKCTACVPGTGAQHKRASNPWNCSCRWLWDATGVLRLEPKSCARVAEPLNIFVNSCPSIM